MINEHKCSSVASTHSCTLLTCALLSSSATDPILTIQIAIRFTGTALFQLQSVSHPITVILSGRKQIDHPDISQGKTKRRGSIQDTYKEAPKQQTKSKRANTTVEGGFSTLWTRLITETNSIPPMNSRHHLLSSLSELLTYKAVSK